RCSSRGWITPSFFMDMALPATTNRSEACWASAWRKYVRILSIARSSLYPPGQLLPVPDLHGIVFAPIAAIVRTPAKYLISAVGKQHLYRQDLLAPCRQGELRQGAFGLLGEGHVHVLGRFSPLQGRYRCHRLPVGGVPVLGPLRCQVRELLLSHGGGEGQHCNHRQAQYAKNHDQGHCPGYPAPPHDAASRAPTCHRSSSPSLPVTVSSPSTQPSSGAGVS